MPFSVFPTDVDEFDAVVGDGVEGDGEVLELVVLVLRPLVVPGATRGQRFSIIYGLKFNEKLA